MLVIKTRQYSIIKYIGSVIVITISFNRGAGKYICGIVKYGLSQLKIKAKVNT